VRDEAFEDRPNFDPADFLLLFPLFFAAFFAACFFLLEGRLEGWLGFGDEPPTPSAFAIFRRSPGSSGGGT
jgi:hypothetical protein